MADARLNPLLQESAEERQSTLLRQGQDRVECRGVDPDDAEERSRIRRERRHSWCRLEPWPERFSTLDNDVDREERHGGEEQPATRAVRPSTQTVEQHRIEAGDGRDRQGHGGLEQALVDPGRQVETKGVGVGPVDHRGDDQDRRQDRRQPTPDAVQPAAGGEGQESESEGAEHAAVERHTGGDGRHVEGNVRIEKEEQPGELGSHEKAGKESSNDQARSSGPALGRVGS